MEPKVTVIILNWNGKHFLKTCFDALFKSTCRNFDVLLLDNGSEDGSVEFMKKNFKKFIGNKKLRIIASPKNLGFAGGNNEAYKHVTSKSKYVVLLNNDTKVDAEWLNETVKIAEMDDLCAGVGAIDNNILYYKHQWNTYNLVGDPISFMQNNRKKQTIDTTMISGCSFLFKKYLVDKPFDDDYFAYSEDMYLSWLLRLRGYNLKYATKAYFDHFTHSIKKRSKKINSFLVYHGTKNRIMNLFIFYQITNLIKIFPLIVLRELIINIVQPARIVSSLKAYWWLFINLGKISKKRKHIQAKRKVSDALLIREQSYKLYEELNADFKMGILSKEILTLVNFLILVYCKLLNIRTRELYQKK